MAELNPGLMGKTIPANLVDRIPKYRDPLSSSTVKLAVLEILAVLLSGAAGYCYLLYLAGHIRPGAFIVALAIFFIVSFLGTLFGPTLKHRFFVILLEVAAFLVFFYDMKITFLAIAFAAMALFSLWGERQSRNETRNMVRFWFLRSARLKMSKLFTGILLGAMVLFLPQWQDANIFISQDRFDRYYAQTANYLNRVYSKLDLTATVGDFAKNLARLQLAGDPRFESIPPDQQDKILSAAVGDFITNATRNLDIPITPDMSVAEVMYQYIVNLLKGWKEKFGDSFLALWAIAIFVIARGVGAIFTWITMYAGYFFYQALIAWEVIDVVTETKTQEKPLLT